MGLCLVIAVVKVCLKSNAPFKYKDDILADIADGAFYLERQPSGEMKLRTSHNYCLQVQAQLSVCRKTYCDCVLDGQHACWANSSRRRVDQFTTAKAIQFFHKLSHARAAHKLKLIGSPRDPNVECDEDEEDYFVWAESLPMVQWSHAMAQSAKNGMVSLSVCWTWYGASWRLVLQRVQICLLINLHCIYPIAVCIIVHVLFSFAFI